MWYYYFMPESHLAEQSHPQIDRVETLVGRLGVGVALASPAGALEE